MVTSAPSGGEKYTKGVRQALPYIQSFIAQGISPNEGYRILQAGGLGVRRTTYLEAYRDLGNIPRKRSVIDSLRPDTRMPVSAFTEYMPKMSTRFEYVVERQWRDPASGELSTIRRTLAFDDRLSKEEVFTELGYAEAIRGSAQPQGELLGEKIIEARHRTGDIWEAF